MATIEKDIIFDQSYKYDVDPVEVIKVLRKIGFRDENGHMTFIPRIEKNLDDIGLAYELEEYGDIDNNVFLLEINGLFAGKLKSSLVSLGNVIKSILPKEFLFDIFLGNLTVWIGWKDYIKAYEISTGNRFTYELAKHLESYDVIDIPDKIKYFYKIIEF